MAKASFYYLARIIHWIRYYDSQLAPPRSGTKGGQEPFRRAPDSLSCPLIFSVSDESLNGGTIALYTWGNKPSTFDNVVVRELPTNNVLLSEDFNGGDFNGWTVVDEGTTGAPSAWSAATGALVQSSNIYTYDGTGIAKPGTYLFYGQGLINGTTWDNYEAGHWGQR